MDRDVELDGALLANVGPNWVKAAMVVARILNQFPGEDDSYLGRRLELLSERGLVEAQGDLSNLRHSEVRLPQGNGDA